MGMVFSVEVRGQREEGLMVVIEKWMFPETKGVNTSDFSVPPNVHLASSIIYASPLFHSESSSTYPALVFIHILYILESVSPEKFHENGNGNS